ncbi:MAG: dephospho-CoA kinase [Clostridiaceae bacterium]|nr:dephospho-CoA kinase [Clostridiaceae bacterium]
MQNNKKQGVKIIGLTGGTGSGKSTVSQIASQLGVYVIDADIVAREVVKKGKKALEEIIDYFGPGILLENGELDRRKLGSIVFADREKLRILNEITHKYIIEEIIREIKIHGSTSSAILIDAAILIETGLYKMCDEVWVVSAAAELRKKRIMERDGLSAQEAENRIKSQMSEDEMKHYASAIIDNNKDMEHVRLQVIKLLK